MVELRRHSLSRAGLHFPDGFLKVVHAGTDAAHDFSAARSNIRRFNSTMLMAGSFTSMRMPCCDAISATSRFRSIARI